MASSSSREDNHPTSTSNTPVHHTRMDNPSSPNLVLQIQSLLRHEINNEGDVTKAIEMIQRVSIL